MIRVANCTCITTTTLNSKINKKTGANAQFKIYKRETHSYPFTKRSCAAMGSHKKRKKNEIMYKRYVSQFRILHKPSQHVTVLLYIHMRAD